MRRSTLGVGLGLKGRSTLNPRAWCSWTLDRAAVEGASTKMARGYRRASKGERCRAPVPHGHWKTTTFAAGRRLNGMVAPLVLDGPMTGAAFLAYVEQLDRAAIKGADAWFRRHRGHGHWTAMLSRPAHKVGGVHAAIEAAGATLLYLPPLDSAAVEPPTSTRSKWRSPSSRHCCGASLHGRSRHCGRPSPPRSIASRPANTKTTSSPLVMNRNKSKML